MKLNTSSILFPYHQYFKKRKTEHLVTGYKWLYSIKRPLCRERNTKLEGRFIFKVNFPGTGIINMSRKTIFFPLYITIFFYNEEVKERALIMITAQKVNESNILELEKWFGDNFFNVHQDSLKNHIQQFYKMHFLPIPSFLFSLNRS